jgi:hypothetical protein
MAQDPRIQRELSPEEVAAEVAAILAAAERDARATIDAARRLPWLSDVSPALDRAADSDAASGASDDRLRASVGELTGAVQSLERRVAAIETALEGSLAPQDSGAKRGAPPPPFAAWERAKSPEPQGAPDTQSARDGARAARVQVVDLALRGYSRAQIAAELRGSLGEIEAERLLDDVLEQH